MAKATKKRVAARKKSLKRGKASTKPARKMAAKHATPKKAKSKIQRAGMSAKKPAAKKKRPPEIAERMVCHRFRPKAKAREPLASLPLPRPQDARQPAIATPSRADPAQARDQHHLPIREFQRIVMGRGVVHVDRILLSDYRRSPRQRRHHSSRLRARSARSARSSSPATRSPRWARIGWPNWTTGPMGSQRSTRPKRTKRAGCTGMARATKCGLCAF